ncbi:restriction endonuclease subunit S, partial [Enhygromyxa salina]|uniref:restriction endonuclease subunit S n=1 Tax=Enhygromyxa salina TaxID=215803 RepID=UPI0011BA9E1C
MSGRAATLNIIPGQYALSVGDTGAEAPPGWCWTPLVDIARLESGHTPSRSHPEWWGGHVPWIGIKDARIHHGMTILTTLECTNDAGLANSAARILPEGTVCLSRTASVGYVVVMGRDMATSQDFVNWICAEGLNPEWLKHLFIAENQSLHSFSKGTTHSTIYFPEVKAFHICLPPLNEQRRIVAKIEALQTHSDAAKQALDAIGPLLERFRQSVLAAAFRGDLTASWREQNPDVEPASALLERIRVERKARFIAAAGDKARATAEAKARAAGKAWTEADAATVVEKARAKAEAKYVEPEPVDTAGLPELPRGWCWARAEEVSDFITKGTTPDSTSMTQEHGDIPYIKVYNLTMNGALDFSIDPTYIDKETHAGPLSRSGCKPGDVLMNIVGPPLGKVSIVPTAYAEWNINQAIVRYRPLGGLCSKYLSLTLLSDSTLVWAQRRAKATSGQLNLTLEICRSLPVPIAPSPEQKELVSAVNRCLNLNDALNQGAAMMEQMVRLNQSILAKAFRGELVPQDPNDEPASVLLERIRAERAAAPTKKNKKSPRPRKPKTSAHPPSPQP